LPAQRLSLKSMTGRIHFSLCPVCGSSAIQNILSAKDHTVSGETFPIDECMKCTLRFTQNTAAENVSQYYKSEEYVSHSNSSKGLINRLYYMIRRKTMIIKRRMVEKISGLRSGVLLDVGSGTGTFVKTMKGRGWDVTGLEPDSDARNLAKKEYHLELSGTENIYKFPEKSFDVITLWHVLEHVQDLSSYIKVLSSLLKENGWIFIVVPNYTSFDARVYKECWASYDVPRHIYHFSPVAMETLIKMNGMRIEKYKAMWFDSFYISLLSSKYRNEQLMSRNFRSKGKPGWIFAIWVGIISNLFALFNVKKCSSVIYVIRN